MSQKVDQERLMAISQLVLDQRLAALRDVAARRAQSQMQIAALDQTAEPADLPPVVAGQVFLRYQLWADMRRSDLNALLARQTAEWLEARDAAGLAFGRSKALCNVVKRLAGRP